MTLFELTGSASMVERSSRPSETLVSVLLRLIDRLGGAHYDTVAARKNPRPLDTWTPNGWC
ncbi:hypothetical protein [Rhodoplanes roseus]|uniref:Uncharacterized protein n=1 Tax=Rhodoplanes roseus TaxID=29409 RepID=A0A327KW50_9BRAD|nr:hypothetical protein [Rhodoplanes roseus]RAI42437.1 hypothetical protein CH341_19565 [Rhodoplanes roseus]